MRRIAFILTLVAVATGAWAVTASAGDERTYKVELDNGFGLVPGSDVKVAGVIAGSIQDLDVNEAKRAVVTIAVEGPFSDFREDATCSSEPQSLIAEYFIDCQPGNSTTSSNGFIPVENTTTTVSNDLVNNILRQPYKQRFQLILNEFGTALAGNPENLNAAIRRGAPALRNLREALDILGRQNKVIRDLNVDSDKIIGLLAGNRANIVRFVKTAGDTAEISASRRADLRRDFQLLPDFLAQLQPNLAKLGALADQQTPLLSDLNASASQLERLTGTLPAFNRASKPSLKTLGDAAKVGKRALSRSRDEIAQLKEAGVSAEPAAEGVADFLKSLDDPRMAVEEDTRAYAKCDSGAPEGSVAAICAPNEQAGDNCRATPQDQLPSVVSDPNNPERTITPPPTPPQCNAFQPVGTGAGKSRGGYTGLEGLINYVYWQTTAINQFDHVGHLLHFILYEDPPGTGFSPCHEFNAHSGVPDQSNPQSPDPREISYTHDADEAHRCVSWLGDSQPDVTEFTGLIPYPSEVCPDDVTDPYGVPRHGVHDPEGTDEPGTLFNPNPDNPGLAIKNKEVCDPDTNVNPSRRQKNSVELQESQQQQPESPVDILDGKGGLPLDLLPDVPDARKGLRGLLDAPNNVLRGLRGSGSRNLGLRRRSDPAAADDLLNFLFGS